MPLVMGQAQSCELVWLCASYYRMAQGDLQLESMVVMIETASVPVTDFDNPVQMRSLKRSFPLSDVSEIIVALHMRLDHKWNVDELVTHI